MHAHFLAKLLGLYLTLGGLPLIFRPTYVQKIATVWLENRPLIFLWGIISLLFGLIILLLHSSWLGWQAIITVIGYLLTLRGIATLWLTDLIAKKFRPKASLCRYAGVLLVIFGLILIYSGFGL